MRASSTPSKRGEGSPASDFQLRLLGADCIIAKMAILEQRQVKTFSARDAKNRFGYLIDIARQEPVSVEKHGRPVVVVLSIEDYERLLARPPQKADKRRKEAR